MQLRRLTIRSLPGIEPGFTFEPRGAGVNLVVGPNAIGKSSLTRALKYLLGNASNDPHALSLEAEFEGGGTRWDVVRNGSQIAWRRDGSATSRPALPGAEQIDLYRLSVESLLDHSDASDRELAARLRRELFGNVDLDALRSEIQGPRAKRFGGREAGVLAAADKARRQVESEYAALERREAELPELKKRIAAAADAEREALRLKEALTLAAAVETRKERHERLKRHPPELAQLEGNELERLEQRNQKAEGLREELRAQTQKLETASAKLERTRLASATLSQEELQAVKQKLDGLVKLSADRDHAHDETVKLEAAERDARQQLGGSGEPPRIDADTCRLAEEIGSEWIRARQRLVELENQPEEAGEAPPSWTPWAAAAAAAGAIGAAWAAYAQSAAAALIAALAAVLAAAAAVGMWLARAQRERAGETERIRAKIAKAREELDRLERAKSDLAAEIGFDPELPVTYLDRFIHRCSDWDKARTEHVKHVARLAELDRQIAATSQGVREFLDAWPADAARSEDAQEPPDLDLLRATFDGLRQRVQDADAARAELRNGNTHQESLRKQIDDVENEVQELYDRAGCTHGDRAALDGRLEQWPDWNSAKKALEEAATEERLARDKLKDMPDLVAHADAGGRAQLQAAHEAAAGKAADHTRLIQEQQAIHTKLEAAGADHKLEEAADAEERARQALEDRREEALLAEATAFLLDDVEHAFEAEHEPNVLRWAREVFAEVTARAFDLRLDPDGTFIAHDLRQDAPRALAELSSGTRMQLLLALRLAWTDVQEQGGETLPLFLDEALTTSDEERFAVMASSLERIARAANGRQRQIFYLSARRHEAALWRQATGSEPAVIDLAAARFPSAAAHPKSYRVENAATGPAAS